MFSGLPDPEPDLLVRGTDPAPAPDPSLFSYIIVLSGLKQCLENKILKQNFSQKLIFQTEDDVPVGRL